MSFVTHLAMGQSLDYETYKKSVEPIFTKKRAGHARCVACHSASNNAFRLQPLAEGSTLDRRAIAPQLRVCFDPGESGESRRRANC